LEIELEDSRVLKLTPDHLVMTKAGWKKAEDLTLDDEILSVYS
jgi:intein/homing endonuclease